MTNQTLAPEYKFEVEAVGRVTTDVDELLTRCGMTSKTALGNGVDVRGISYPRRDAVPGPLLTVREDSARRVIPSPP